MSLLSRDELRVLLCRDQLQVVRVACRLTLKGWKYSVSDKFNVSFESDPESSWKNAIEQLESVIAGTAIKPELVRVVLSNHFLRYAIVKVDQSLKSEVEKIAFVKHRFSQLYGEDAHSWELRLDQVSPGAPFFASAIDEPFLLGIRDVCARSNVKLQSVQPSLMKAYNQCHAEFKDKNAWFIQFEHGSLCLILLQDGQPRSVRLVKVGDDWSEKLFEIIDREAFLSELDAGADEIYLWSYDNRKIVPPKDSPWKITLVKLEIPAGFAEYFDEQYALAMCG